MNGKHAIYRVYQALCAGMLRLFPAGRQTLVQGDGCITKIPELLKTHGIKAVQIITTPGTIRRRDDCAASGALQGCRHPDGVIHRGIARSDGGGGGGGSRMFFCIRL